MIEHNIHPEQALIVVTVSGTVDVEEILSSIHALRLDANYNNQFKAVWDFRTLDGAHGLDAVQDIVGGIGQLPGAPPAMSAMLVGTPRNTALATLYGQLAQHLHQSKAFSTVNAAGTWLDVNLAPYVH